MEVLLAKAADLFRRKGYAGATTRELADAIGVQKASLYHHIGGKEDLLFAICTQSLDRINADVTAAVATAPAGRRVARLVEAHLVSATGQRDMHAAMLVELRSLGDERLGDVLARRAAYEDLVHSVIAGEQEAGRIRSDIPTGQLTLALLNLLNWTIFWFRPDGELGAGEFAAVLADIFLNGAATQSAPAIQGAAEQTERE